MPARRKSRAEGFEEENPEWTEEDFSRARPAHEILPPDVLSVFKKTRGPQRASKKVPVSIRLSAEVVEHFRELGPGWQRRIDEVLKKAIARSW